MTVLESARSPSRCPAARHHPALALTIIAASQLMVVLDATIVNIAPARSSRPSGSPPPASRGC